VPASSWLTDLQTSFLHWKPYIATGTILQFQAQLAQVGFKPMSQVWATVLPLTLKPKNNYIKSITGHKIGNLKKKNRDHKK